MADYDSSLTERLYTRLRDEYAGASEIRLFMEGDVFDKGLSRLPMLSIDLKGVEVTSRALGIDFITETVRFTVTISKLDEIGNPVQDENANKKKLEHIVQGMLDSRHYHPESLLAVLRRSLTVDSYGQNSFGNIEYTDDTANPEKTTAEAFIDWTFMRRVAQLQDA